MYTSFQDALKAVLNDRRIRREDWKEGIFVALTSDGILRDQSGDVVDLALNRRENIKGATDYKWEILPTTEEILLIKGKAYDVGRHCNCVAENECNSCALFDYCDSLNNTTEFFIDTIANPDMQPDDWFSYYEDMINEMWEMIKDE